MISGVTAVLLVGAALSTWVAIAIPEERSRIEGGEVKVRADWWAFTWWLAALLVEVF